MPDGGLSPEDALVELRELMRNAAVSDTYPRISATRYTICRDTVLQSPLRPHLPGFLHQCLTLARFHDFIHLLDPGEETRLQFLDQSFQHVAGRPFRRPTIDILGEPDDF